MATNDYEKNIFVKSCMLEKKEIDLMRYYAYLVNIPILCLSLS